MAATSATEHSDGINFDKQEASTPVLTEKQDKPVLTFQQMFERGQSARREVFLEVYGTELRLEQATLKVIGDGLHMPDEQDENETEESEVDSVRLRAIQRHKRRRKGLPLITYFDSDESESGAETDEGESGAETDEATGKQHVKKQQDFTRAAQATIDAVMCSTDEEGDESKKHRPPAFSFR